MCRALISKLAAVFVEQADQSVMQAPAIVQDAQDLAQGLAQVERAAQDAADLEQGGQLGFQQVQPVGVRGVGGIVAVAIHSGSIGVIGPPGRH